MLSLMIMKSAFLEIFLANMTDEKNAVNFHEQWEQRFVKN